MEFDRPLDLNNFQTKPADKEMTEEKLSNEIMRKGTKIKNAFSKANLRKRMKT